MDTRKYIVSFLLLVGLGSADVAVPASGQTSNRDTLAFSFAFTDSDGKRAILLTNTEVSIPREMFAVTANGERQSFRRLREQKASYENSDRDIAPNFQNLPGWVFQSHKSIGADKTVLLVSGSFLSSHAVIPIHREQSSPLDSITTRRIEQARGLKIDRS
jgi:hypothetical protein